MPVGARVSTSGGRSEDARERDHRWECFGVTVSSHDVRHPM
ncbi:hypothetical protein [Nocardiopsis valliformis]|nr:hypothetical protein [Nocardiopsis valliformis]